MSSHAIIADTRLNMFTPHHVHITVPKSLNLLLNTYELKCVRY